VGIPVTLRHVLIAGVSPPCAAAVTQLGPRTNSRTTFDETPLRTLSDFLLDTTRKVLPRQPGSAICDATCTIGTVYHHGTGFSSMQGTARFAQNLATNELLDS